MGFTTTEALKLTFKVQAGGVIDAASGNQWYESKFPFNPSVNANRVLTQFDQVKLYPAADLSTAQAAAVSIPSIIQDRSPGTFSSFRLTQVTSGDDSTWVTYDTYNDRSSTLLDLWIQPQRVPKLDGDPSIGYSVKLYSGDPAVSGLEITTTVGQTTGGEVGWVFNYDMGMLFVANDLITALSPGGSLIGTYPEGLDFYIRGFRYIGQTLADATFTGGGTVSFEDSSTIGFTQSGITYSAYVLPNSLTASSLNTGLSGGATAGYILSNTGDGNFAWVPASTGGSASGSSGTSGYSGTSGSSGTSGTSGISGSNGSSGTSGTSGTSGVSGSNGSSGTSGTSGTSGVSGSNGSSGTSGTSGSSGTSGTSGVSGSNGSSGTSGVSGSNGSSGTSGTSGSSGTSGTSGSSGTSGVSGSPAGVITDSNAGISISYGSTNSTIDTTYNTALDPSLAMPNTVGGIASGTTAGTLSGLNLVQLFDDLLFPTVTPTYTIPTIVLASTVTGIKEVGETVSPAVTLTGTENDANYFSQLVIQKSVNGAGASTLLTVSATSSMTITSASSIASQFGYADPNNPNFSYAISTTDSGLVIPAPVSGGNSTVVYSGLGDYTAGLAKKNNKGVTHSASAAVRSTLYPQAASTNFAPASAPIIGYYPYFYGKSSTQKSASDIVTIIQSGSGFTKVVNTGSGSLSMAFSASGEWPWFAIYSVYPTKLTWYETALNNGNIGLVPTDLFAAPTTLSVISSDGYWTVTYKIYPANKVTTLGTATIA